MRRRLLESKVHRDARYVGLVSPDPFLIGAADAVEHEPRLEPARR